MLKHIIQLNKVQAKLLLPSFSSLALNKESKEPLQSAIPQICLKPRGGFWFDIVASEEDILKFLVFADKKELILTYSTRNEAEIKESKALDIEGFDSTEVPASFNLQKVRIKVKTRDEITDEERMANEEARMLAEFAAEQELIDTLPSPATLFAKKS